MDIPQLSKQSKVGSNVKGHKAIHAADARRIERQLKPIRRLERQFLIDRRAIFTQSVVKQAAALLQEHRDAYTKAFLKANGDGAAIDRARRRVRRSIDRALLDRIPRFRKFDALRRRFTDQYQVLVEAQHAASPAAALEMIPGDVALPVDLAFDVFRPPFTRFDVVPPRPNASAVPPSSSGPADNSFAQPDSGIVVTNVQYHFEHDGSFVGFNPTRYIEHHSAVGIDYRVPETGFMFGSAVIQNLFNKFTMSVHDLSGLSDADLHMDQSIFVRIIRAFEVIPFAREVFSRNLASFGDDLSSSTSPIQNSTPFTINFETQVPFLKGERVQILVGANLNLEINVDDMSAFMSVLTMWQVKRISLGIRV